MNDSLIRKVRNTISGYHMIRPGERVVVAVSGGPDSVCLLDILYKLKDELDIGLIVAHFDHGLRQDHDEAETRFVRSLAVSLELPFETTKALAGIHTGAGPLEERARHARYGFLEDVKEKFSAEKIAVGHNLNDQAETVLMRLMRGSGLSGLSGIPPKRDGKIIRPLIETTRDEIMVYVEQHRLKFITDHSNFETRFMRNRIRLELLPKLKEIQPRIIELLGQTSDIMRRDDAWMTAESEKWFRDIAKKGPDGEVSIPLSVLKQLSEALRFRVFRHALKQTGGTLRRISMRHTEAIDRLATAFKPQALMDLPNGLVVRRTYDRLVFKRGKQGADEAFSHVLEKPGTYNLDRPMCTVLLEELEKTEQPYPSGSQWTAFLDADKISYPLVIRNFRPGDRFVPFGMSGHKKLKDFFIDLKIPAEVRNRTPILTQHDMPVWVCGFRIDDRFKVTPDTWKVLKVHITLSDP